MAIPNSARKNFREAAGRRKAKPGAIRFLRLFPALALGVATLALPGFAEPEQAEGRLGVFVSIAPQAWVVEQIGGGHVAAEVLLPAGSSPHTYDPSPRQVAGMARAGIFFTVGLSFERGLTGRIATLFPKLVVADAKEGIELKPLGNEAGNSPDRSHVESGPDPHFWLDPILAGSMARNICVSLCRLDPAHENEYRANFSALSSDLEESDRRIAALLAPYRGRKIYVFHPAFGYFAGRYGLVQVAVQTGGHDPSARDLSRLIERMGQESVKVIFVQPEFSQTVARTLEQALGCRAESLDPLSRDYLPNLESMARKIASALKE